MQKDNRNLSRIKKEARQTRRDSAEKKITNIRERLLRTLEREGDFKGPNTIGWGLDKNDNPIRS